MTHPLLLSARNGQPDVLKLLLGYVELPFVLFRAAIDGFDALFASVEQDHPACIEILKNFGVSLEERTSADNEILREATPLHLAAYYSRIDAANMLLKLGADPNSRDINGMTPLHIAVLRKQHAIIELLVAANADPFVLDKSGNTPAAFCRSGDPKIISALVNPCTLR